MATRRDFLKGAGAALLAFLGGCSSQPDYPVVLHKGSQKRGHAIFASFSAPKRTIKTEVAIIGSGIAALTCAWKLAKCGMQDFRIFELEDQPGGNSRSASYPESRAPWAAHYLPLPTREATATIEMLNDLGLVTGFAPNGDPIYDEESICHDPMERLYEFGKWTEGFYPSLGANPEDIRQVRAFYDRIKRFQEAKLGQRAFTIPLAYATDEQRALDSITIDEYLRREGFTSERLRWHVEYGCRDDYGTSLTTTSAWAALSYFAARNPDKPGPAGGVLTWPEGNGWFVHKLQKTIGERLTLNALVYHVANTANGVELDYMDPRTRTTTRVQAKYAVCAFPTFLRPMIVAGDKRRRSFTYCPWATANLVLRHLPAPGKGFPVCWDNVIYSSPTLGYVVATHQSLQREAEKIPTVITWYRAYAENPDPRQTRWHLLHRSAESYRQEIIQDLSLAHPDLPQLITRMEIMLLGHAMIRPIPGLIWGTERQEAQQPQGNLYFAHSDLSGLSIFEEAQFHGVRAAEQIMQRQGISFNTSLAPL